MGGDIQRCQAIRSGEFCSVTGTGLAVFTDVGVYFFQDVGKITRIKRQFALLFDIYVPLRIHFDIHQLQLYFVFSVRRCWHTNMLH